MDAEVIDHLIEHVTMLPGHANDAFYLPALAAAVDHGRHLDGFRPGAERQQNFQFCHGRCFLRI